MSGYEITRYYILGKIRIIFRIQKKKKKSPEVFERSPDGGLQNDSSFSLFYVNFFLVNFKSD